MSKLKKGKWKPEEVKELLKITKGPKSAEQLRKLAEELNRDLTNLRAKWSYERNKDNGSKDEEDWDTPMEFKIDKTVKTPIRRTETADVVRMRAGLDNTYPKLEPNGGNIPIPNHLSGYAKRHLNSVFPESPSIFNKVMLKGKPTGFTRIFKKKMK